MYGPRHSRSRWEYINAGIYVFAAILLVGGFAAQLSAGRLEGKSGLVLLLIGLALVIAVNVHDLVAHLAGVDYCVSLVEYDVQLGLVEFAAPVVQIVGSVLTFVGVLFLLIQMERGYSYRLEKHGLNLLIAGPVLWVVGSIHNLCQIYERADGHAQILQKTVQIPFLMASLLFLVGGVFNKTEIFGSVDHKFKIMVKSWIWLCISGSLLLFIGGLFNVVKIFKMQQMDGVRLEKLRGGAQERLGREREGKVPLILEDSRRKRQLEEARTAAPVPTKPYKDVLVGGSEA